MIMQVDEHYLKYSFLQWMMSCKHNLFRMLTHWASGKFGESPTSPRWHLSNFLVSLACLCRSWWIGHHVFHTTFYEVKSLEQRNQDLQLWESSPSFFQQVELIMVHPLQLNTQLPPCVNTMSISQLTLCMSGGTFNLILHWFLGRRSSIECLLSI